MTSTYEMIATNTVSGAGTSTITFSSIPATYTDLVIVISGTAASGVGTYFRFNSDTGSNYSYSYVYGNGSSALSSRSSSVTSGNFGNLYTTQTTIINSIMNYSNTTTYKTNIGRHNNAGAMTLAVVGLWRSTAAINSIQIFPDGANFGNATTLTLYGIKAE
jgi:hypothetical protein